MKGPAVVTLNVVALSVVGCGIFSSVPEHTLGRHFKSGTTDCDLGFADCNADIDDGCETDLATDTSCGACGLACHEGRCEEGVCMCSGTFATCGADACLVDLANDPKNCGACGRDCSPGGCDLGHCQPANLEDVEPAGFSIQAQSVYFVQEQITIRRSATDTLWTTKSPGNSKVFAASQLILRLGTTNDSLLWLDGGGAVWRVGLDGAGPARLAQYQFGVFFRPPFEVAFDSAYWVAINATSTGLVLRHVAKGGGAVEDLDTVLTSNAAIATEALSVGGAHVYWLPDTQSVSVYDLTTKKGSAIAVSGGKSTSVSAAFGRVCATALSSDMKTTLLCQNEGDNTLAPMATLDGPADSVAVGAHAVFFADQSRNRVLAAIANQPLVKVAQTEGAVLQMRVVGDDLYWSTTSGVYRLRHPSDFF